MSIPVEIDQLADTMGDFGAGYLLTADGSGQVKVVSVVPRLAAGVLVCAPSRGTARNLEANPLATLVLPPRTDGSMTLLVDGTGRLVDDAIEVTPTSAVLHKPAS